METFETKVNRLVERTIDNNMWRQRKGFNLIPSETTPSLIVKLVEISDPSGRYAEHRTIGGRETYYYAGTDFIRGVEEELITELKTFTSSSQVEPRPISGNMANNIVYQAIVKYLKRNIASVINNSLINGGHLSAQPLGVLFGYVETNPDTGKEKIVNFPVMQENPYRTDTSRLEDLIEGNKPELIIFGKSTFLFPEPVAYVRKLVENMDRRPIIMYDMAHVLGLNGIFQKPLAEGADLLTGSTHKTFFGPQRGIIASNFEEGSEFYKGLWVQIKNRSFPGNTSNHHLGTLLGLLMATYEMNEFKDAYQTQVISNAKAFAKALSNHGIQVEGEADGYTETHQVIINVRRYGNGIEIAKRLEDNNIITNFQALPYDETFNAPNGIRMGVQEMTRFGMKEKDFNTLASYMAEVIQHKRNVKDEITRDRDNFMQMQYTLEPSKTLPLIARLITSIMPNTAYAKQFAENIMTAVK